MAMALRNDFIDIYSKNGYSFTMFAVTRPNLLKQFAGVNKITRRH